MNNFNVNEEENKSIVLYNNKKKLNNITNTIFLKTKNCPHCGKSSECPFDTKYVICGYDYNYKFGYDWEGCRKDWCFQCGKMLCKQFSDDYLFAEKNQFHNGTCCFQDSKNKNKEYILDYCQCTTENVNRSL
jgi:hypothetical protein